MNKCRYAFKKLLILGFSYLFAKLPQSGDSEVTLRSSIKSSCHCLPLKVKSPHYPVSAERQAEKL